MTDFTQYFAISVVLFESIVEFDTVSHALFLNGLFYSSLLLSSSEDGPRAMRCALRLPWINQQFSCFHSFERKSKWMLKQSTYPLNFVSKCTFLVAQKLHLRPIINVFNGIANHPIVYCKFWIQTTIKMAKKRNKMCGIRCRKRLSLNKQCQSMSISENPSASSDW